MASRSRKIFLYSALLIVAFASISLLSYDNTDHGTRSFSFRDSEVRMFSAKNPELYQAIKKEYEEEVLELEAVMKEKGANAKGSCLKDPSATSSPKEQLQSFIEGDCAPVIVVPGFLSTKMMVEIDCETLMANNPEIMDACGWGTCSWSLWYSRPSTEYLFWIPSLFHRVNMVTFLSNSTCFGRLARFEYNASASNNYEKYLSPKGVRITWYGNTESTRSELDSGFGAITDILPSYIQVQDTRGFKGAKEYLQTLGYQTGLTLFAIPYIWLKTYVSNEASFSLERTVRYAYEMTGKKVVIFSHSLGNLNTLPMLNGMSQEDKDRMIAAYTAIAPPYSGSPNLLLYGLAGGNPAFVTSIGLGVNFFNQGHLSAGASVTQDMVPKDPFFRFKNETWMQELVHRVQMEKANDPATEEGRAFWKNIKSEEVPISFFPNPSEKCFDGYGSRIDECLIGISDMNVQPVGIIKGKKYYASKDSMKEIVAEHYTIGDLESFWHMWNDTLASGVEKMINPGVPVVFFYGSHLQTDVGYEWEYAPEEKTLKGEFAFPERYIKSYGDGTVGNTYSLPIALKWAWENRNKKENAKPIKIVEFCSSYKNMADTFWDSYDENGTAILNKTEYLGFPCYCGEGSKPKSGSSCSHAKIVGDPYMIEAISNIARTNQKVQNKEKTAGFRLPNSELVRLIETAPFLTRPYFDQDVKIWLDETLVLLKTPSYTLQE